ncbi:unnamed protein product [Urochloa humidicola]
MKKNEMLQSLGIPSLASVLNSSNANSLGIPVKILDTSNTSTGSVTIPTGGTRGPKRVLVGPILQGLAARMTMKRTMGQSGEEGINGTSTDEEDDAFIVAPAAPASPEQENLDLLQRSTYAGMQSDQSVFGLSKGY